MPGEKSVVVNRQSSAPQVQEIDRALRSLAQQQAALDADEAHWLRIAEQQNAWPALGYVHGLEYLEDVFGYAPRTAMERLRVARELGALPRLEDALRVGELSYSAVRELTRVATPETVERWIEQARGRRFRDVEQMVSGRRKGDDPDDAPDPALVKHRIVLELDGESFALWRHMQAMVEQQREQKLDDRQFVLAIGDRMLRELGDCSPDVRSTGDGQDVSGAAIDPQFLIQKLSSCTGCDRVWQDAGGVRVEVGKSLLERAECNAIICDDEHGKRPKRTIPKKTARLVLERAQHRCQVPGCRSSKHLTIHHIKFFSHGGTHALWNLIVLCDGHHRLLHDGLLQITGRAPDELVFTRNGAPMRAMNDNALASARTLAAERTGRASHASAKHGVSLASRTPGTSILRASADDSRSQADQALRQLGFKAAVAASAVEAACASVGADAEIGVLIKEALRHCNHARQ
jgi:hypothetical protein